jgi:hypothetical protein
MYKSMLMYIVSMFSLIGLEPIKGMRNLLGLPLYVSTYRELKKQVKDSGIPFVFGRAYPCLQDAKDTSGMAGGHYFHQDLLVAARIFDRAPIRHIDVGSRVDGFVAHVAVFRDIEVLDIRPLKSSLSRLKFIQADMMGELPQSLIGSCESLSCLHALEHFGLGRYGDPVRWDGHILGLKNLQDILIPGGKLYLSVPIGPQRIEFNAHRVFSIGYLLNLFDRSFIVDDFSFVDDAGDLRESVQLDNKMIEENCGCIYGCGIFELTKLPS